MNKRDKIKALNTAFNSNSSKALAGLMSEPLVCIHNLSTGTISIPDILNRKMVEIPSSEFPNLPIVQGRKVEMKINLGKGVKPPEDK